MHISSHKFLMWIRIELRKFLDGLSVLILIRGVLGKFDDDLKHP
jgi:hypothetical protein